MTVPWRTRSVHPQGLSAPVRDLHRPGDPGAGGARPDIRIGLAAASDRSRGPSDPSRDPAPVAYLPEYLYQEPLRVLRAWRRGRRRPGYGEARRAWLRDLRRDPTPNRVRRFGQALVLAAELPARRHHAACPFPAHAGLGDALCQPADRAALELFRPRQGHLDDAGWEKREKLAAAAWTVTCTAAGPRSPGGLGAGGRTWSLVYHGLDLRRFGAPGTQPPSHARRQRCPGDR